MPSTQSTDAQRLAIVEAEVDGIHQRLGRMEATSERIESKLNVIGKPDMQSWWAAAGVGVAILAVVAALAIPIVGGFAGIIYIGYQALTAEVGAVESRSAMRNTDMKALMADVKSDAATADSKRAADNRDERLRNDSVERALGRLEGFSQAKEGYRW